MKTTQTHSSCRRSIVALHVFATFYLADVIYTRWAHDEVPWRSLALGLTMLVVGQVMRRRNKDRVS